MLADRQLPAVRAERMRPAPAGLVPEGRLPVGHAPHAQRVPFAEAEQEPLVGAEEQVFPRDRSRGDAPDLPVVGDAADADDPLGVGAGVEPVLPAVRRPRSVPGARSASPARGGGRARPSRRWPRRAAARRGGCGRPRARAARLSSRWPICRLKRPARARFHSARNNWSVASRSLCRAAASAASFCLASFTATACASVARIMPQVVPMMPPTRARTHQGRRQDRPFVPPHELPQPVAHRRRTGQHRLVGQVTLQVHRQPVGRLVAPVAVLLQRLHHDPVQVALDQPAQPGGLRPAVRGDRCQARPRLRESRSPGRPRGGAVPARRA